MRTVYCGNLDISNVGSEVILCGWVNRHRIFSDFIFIEIRDREGSVQVFIDSSSDNDMFLFAMDLRNESCLRVIGIVRARPVHQVNHNMKTGAIEVLATHLKIISFSDPLPLDLNQENTEEQRLKYRYLDLRRPIMFQRLKNRSRVTFFIHRFMERNGFLNIETPMLTRSIPEGARDYLVPSRLHQGKFYALPQSPQLFKQLLMISGFDRYYQIIKCFRDEDMRSDRQPEFTQVDIETSFMSAGEVREIIESLICSLWYEILGVELKPFVQLTYKEVMDRFASDHPDLRNPIEIIYISDVSQKEIICNDSICFNVAQYEELKVMVMFIPYGARLVSYEIDQYVDDFKRLGGGNLTWIKVHGFGSKRKIEGSGVHFFSLKIIKRILLEVCISEKDILFLSCSYRPFLNSALDFLRVKLGHDLQLIKKDSWSPLWVVDFPMFKRNKEGDIMSVHHLFTAPKDVDSEFLLEYPLSVLADSFDIVINGCEVGSGSVRIHSYEMQKIVFKILGFTEEFQNNHFDFLLNALRYGPPIHAGIACGLDRLVMLLCGTNNIRDVIAFPKTTNAVDLMTKTPGFLDNVNYA